MLERTHVCGDCKQFKRQDCPFNEYRNSRVNQAACLSTDLPCEAFEARETSVSQDTNSTVKFLSFPLLSDSRICEQGFDGTDVYFLVYTPTSNSVHKTPRINFGDYIAKPIDNDEVRNSTVLLPSDVLEYESEEQLTNQIRAFLNRWHESPDVLSRELDVFYCLLTYIHDLIPQLPYRRYLAPWGKGKSAWMEALGWICYRGIVLAGSDTDKSVVRKLNKWQVTALVDEADFGDSSFYAFIVKILNIGYDQKTGFYHRCDDEDPTNVLTYNVFCPKLLATRSKYKDLALESRCLSTIGRQNRSPMPLFRMETFQSEALELRNKLLLWRFRNYHRIKEAAKQLEDPLIADQIYDGAKNISSRVKQVILPLWLIGGDTIKETLTDLAKTFDSQLKIEDPNYLLEIQAKDAIKMIIDQSDNDSVNIGNDVNILYEGTNSLIEVPLSLISKTILQRQGQTADKIKVSQVTSISKKLKRVFESNLGFKINIGKRRSRVVQVPTEWIRVEETVPHSLNDLLYEEDSHKNVHHVSNVHINGKLVAEPDLPALVLWLRQEIPLGEFHPEDF